MLNKMSELVCISCQSFVPNILKKGRPAQKWKQLNFAKLVKNFPFFNAHLPVSTLTVKMHSSVLRKAIFINLNKQLHLTINKVGLNDVKNYIICFKMDYISFIPDKD